MTDTPKPARATPAATPLAPRRDDYNPFEPDETPDQLNARIGRMIRENVDKRLAAECATPATPAAICNGPFGDEEACPVHGAEIRKARGRESVREANQQRVDAAVQRLRKVMDYRKYLPGCEEFHKDVELLIEIALAPVLEIFTEPTATPMAALTRIQVEALCAGAVREHVDGRIVVDYDVLTELINAALQPAAAQPQRESEHDDDKECHSRKEGYECTLMKGHSGNHEAHGFHEVLYEWPQKERESEQPEQALREIIANMPHNGAVMFSSNKNELGHDQSCYKCKLEAALSPQTDSQEPR